MEPNAQQPTQPATKPVMDVVPPPRSAVAPVVPTAAPVPTGPALEPRSIDGVKTPPPLPGDSDPAAALAKEEQAQVAQPAKPATPKSPKTPRSGVGLAIFATIVIVLALAALFAYAYLRSNNIHLL